MEDHGVPPDQVSFNTLLSGHAKCGDVDGIYDTFAEMLRRKLKPNTITFSCLIDAFAKQGDMDGALEAVEEMKRQKVTRRSLPFSLRKFRDCSDCLHFRAGPGPIYVYFSTDNHVRLLSSLWPLGRYRSMLLHTTHL